MPAILKLAVVEKMRWIIPSEFDQLRHFLLRNIIVIFETIAYQTVLKEQYKDHLEYFLADKAKGGNFGTLYWFGMQDLPKGKSQAVP